MTTGRSVKTLYKLCSCSKMGRGDSFKKHRAGNIKAHQVIATKYYCTSCEVFKFNTTKISEWHKTHTNCVSKPATNEILMKIFSHELSQMNETERAVNSIKDFDNNSVSLSSDLYITESSSDSESDNENEEQIEKNQSQTTLENISQGTNMIVDVKQNKENSKISDKVVTDKDQRTSITHDVNLDKIQPKITNAQEVDLEQIEHKISNTHKVNKEQKEPKNLNAREVDLEQNEPTISNTHEVDLDQHLTSNANEVVLSNMKDQPIKIQCDKYVPHPLLPKNMSQLRIENSRLKDRMYMLTARNENLQKEVDALRSKKCMYETAINENIDLKDHINKIEKERTQLKTMVAKHNSNASENAELSRKMKSMEEKLQYFSKPSTTMIHVPIKDDAVLTRPLFNALGSQHSCFQREKRGIKCAHIIVRHPGVLEGVDYWHTPTKKSKKYGLILIFEIMIIIFPFSSGIPSPLKLLNQEAKRQC